MLIARLLADVCSRNPFVKSIEYSNNKLEDIEIAGPALEMFSYHTSPYPWEHLESVAVTNSCATPDAGDYVCEWLCGYAGFDGCGEYPRSSIVKVDLSSNHITGASTIGSGHYLPDAISQNNGMQVLNLSDNLLDDTEAGLIAEALRKNTNLKSLSLKNNKITEVGKSALKKCISSSESFQALYNCNHTCTIYLGEDDGDVLKNASRDKKMEAAILSSSSEGNLVRDLNAEFDDGKETGSPCLVPETIRAAVRRAWPRGNWSERSGWAHRPSIVQAQKSQLSATYDLMKGFVVPKLCGPHEIKL